MSARRRLVASLLDRARSVAGEAASLLVDQRPAQLEVESKEVATDVVTDMDRRSETLIVDRLLAGGSRDGVLGEEGEDRPSGSGVRWVIDPIDGTVNYLYRLPIWAVCIGAELDGEPVVGVVAVPELGLTYWGAEGSGAWVTGPRGDRPVEVGRQSRLDLSLVATGFGYSVERRTAQARCVSRLLPRVRDIRRVGTASVDLCWLADGRVDAYYEVGLKPWDYTAATVIAREAGATVVGMSDGPPTGDLVAAANPTLLPAFGRLLTECGVGEPEGSGSIEPT